MISFTVVARSAGIVALAWVHYAAFGQSIYKCVDNAGKVLYTDEPCGASKGKRLPVAPAPPRPAAPPIDVDAAYARAVQVIEARYPTLNPDLPGFDRVAAGEVLARMNRYVSQGQSREAAVRIAADEVMGATRRVAAPTQVSAQEPQQVVQGTKQRFDTVGVVILIVAALVALGLAWQLVRWLVWKFSTTAVRAAQIAGTVSASDAARSAGGVVSSVAQKSGELLRRSGRRGKTPWD